MATGLRGNTMIITNWSGNITYHAARHHAPTGIAQLQAIVAHAEKIRVLGSRHSFNTIADTAHDLISLDALPRAVVVDPATRTATVSAGMRYGDLGLALHNAGFALHNMASLPHISLAGAVATATHGSGDGLGNLATAVLGLRFVAADGTLHMLTRADADFAGAVVALGALGVVTELTLAVEPTYQVRQDCYTGLPFAAAVESFDQITASATSVSLFTDWQTTQIWRKQRTTADDTTPAPQAAFGARLAQVPLHPLPDHDPINCTQQLGVPGPWHERLPHFRYAFTPSAGDELQAEYLVPRPHAVAALRAVATLQPQIAPLLLVSEIRTIAADDLWLSPCYQQPCIGIHFTLRRDWAAVRQLLPQIEAALAPFDARPHWGKCFTMPAATIRSHYPMLPAFCDLVRRYDPQGKFQNGFVGEYLGAVRV